MTDNARQLQIRKRQALNLLKTNNFIDAEKELLSLSSLLPKDKILWLELGRIRVNQGRPSDAISYLEKAVVNAPKSAEAHFLLGVASQSSGNTIKGINHLIKALQLDPKNVEISIRIGYAYTGIDNSKAISYFKKALNRQANNPSAIVGLAGLYTYKGDTTAAYKTLSPLLTQQPPNLQAATSFADICLPLKQCEHAIELLNAALFGKHSPSIQCRAHFALGKLYDRQCNYQQAFKHYQKANSINNHTYHPAQDVAFFNGLISSMDSDFFTNTPRAKIIDKDKQPIFIVGMPRSGTTLVEQILATHNHVFPAGELGEIGTIAASIPAEVGASYPSCLNKLNENILNKLSHRYLKAITDISPKEAIYIIDKMPDNFRFLGFIQLLFPNAKVIHCKRNPLDTSLSCYFQNFEGGHNYANDLRNQGIYYRMYEKLMAHWNQVLDLTIHTIEYEALIKNPESTSRALMAFCEFEWTEETLQFFKNSNSVLTASFEQVKQPIYQSSVQRWKNYEEQIQALRDGLEIQLIK